MHLATKTSASERAKASAQMCVTVRSHSWQVHNVGAISVPKRPHGRGGRGPHMIHRSVASNAQTSRQVKQKRRGRSRKKRNLTERKSSPHALQILFPTSSLLQSGVVLVPQFAQLNAPTADLALLDPATGVLVPAPAERLLCSPPSPPGEDISAAPAPPAQGDWATAADGDAPLPSSTKAGTASIVSPVLSDAARVLFSVGHPAQAVDPPVPSHRPSPGHVPPLTFTEGSPRAAGLLRGGVTDEDLVPGDNLREG